MRKLLGAALVVALGAGAVWLYLRATTRQYVFDLRLQAVDPDRKLSVLVNGREAGPFLGKDYLEFEARGGKAREMSAAVLPAITTRYWFPCGWKDVRIEVQAPAADFVRNAQKEKRNIVLWASLQPDYDNEAAINLWVDNRGQPAAEVAVGEFAREVAGGSALQYTFPYDVRCPQGRELRVNGKSVGKLPEDIVTPARARQLKEESKRPPSNAFLLDTLGTRCYRHQFHWYAGFAELNWGSSEPPKPTVLKAQNVHRLPASLDYFLREAPRTLIVNGDNLSVTRTSLVDTSCAAR